MKTKLFFYGRNILDGVCVAMNESLAQSFKSIASYKKTFLLMLFLGLQIDLLSAQDNGTSLIPLFQQYATIIYIVGSIIVIVVLVYSNLHTVIKGINGDTEAWKKLGSAGAWIVVWFIVVPFIYKLFIGKAQNGTPLQ